MERDSLKYKYDELCTRIALLMHKIEISITSVDGYLQMQHELNNLLIKKISIEQRIRRKNNQYKISVYEPDIIIMK